MVISKTVFCGVSNCYERASCITFVSVLGIKKNCGQFSGIVSWKFTIIEARVFTKGKHTRHAWKQSSSSYPKCGTAFLPASNGTTSYSTIRTWSRRLFTQKNRTKAPATQHLATRTKKATRHNTLGFFIFFYKET